MKRLLLILAIISVFTGCKSISCNYHTNRAVKLQERANKHIENLALKGCDFELDSVLKIRTIQKVTELDTLVLEKEVYVEVPSDELIFSQKLRCDSLGRVILDQERRLSRKGKGRVKVKTIVKDNVITVTATCDSLTEVATTQKVLIVKQQDTITNLRKEIEKVKNNERTFLETLKPILIWLALIIFLVILWLVLNRTILKQK